MTNAPSSASTKPTSLTRTHTPFLALLHVSTGSQMSGRTDADSRAYLQSDYFPNTSTADVDRIMPQYKRLAALQGDFVNLVALFVHGSRLILCQTFQGPQCPFLQHRASMQNAWSYGAQFPQLIKLFLLTMNKLAPRWANTGK